MKLVTAFFRLVRLPNLFFIMLTQVLFQVCIYYPLYNGLIPGDDSRSFLLLMAASVLIAAAGYIINDYFDINIDEVNKPQRLVVDKYISRRWAIAWHFILSAAGIGCTLLAEPFLQKGYLVFLNFLCIVLLWFYSSTFKKRLLIGNLVIALLTAWTILLIFFSKFSFYEALGVGHMNQVKFFRFAFLYAGFAFIITLIREAVKDMEDMPGDAKYGCTTLPIAWGIKAAKIYTASWLVILLAELAVVQVYILQFRWWWAVAYCTCFIIAPLLYFFRLLLRASTTTEFHKLSSLAKYIMLWGILSMILFYFYL